MADSSITNLLIDHLWAPVVGLVSLMGKGAISLIHDKVKHVEEKAEKALPKEEFQKYVAEAAESRKELRESVIKLYDRLDELKTVILETKR